MKNKYIKQAVCGVLGAAALLKIVQRLWPSPITAVPRRKKNNAPIVFVHGLGGWGEGSELDNVFPHWGLMAGSVKKHLEAEGHEAYAASVNPVSSTWDRACELYAHLTGTRTDYGEAHAKAHNHERFGPTYEKLGPDWPGESIHLIGHSFGGATIRLFAQFCAEGSAEERAVTPADELSPLFGGTLGGHIASITTLAAPHNGTTALLSPVKGAGVGLLEGLLYSLMTVNTLMPGFQDFFPCHLEQYGMAGNTGLKEAWKQSVAFGRGTGTDSARYDMSIDGAAAVNQSITCQPDIYYFSFAGDITHRLTGNSRLPNASSLSLVTMESSLRMGQKRLLSASSGEIEMDDRWLPNDGLVNTISALHPFDEPHQEYDTANVRPGVWQVMPVVANWDHYDFVGGFRLGGTKGVKAFYLALAQMLEGLPQ